MPPHEDEPAWPSDDSDSTAGADEQPQDDDTPDEPTDEKSGREPAAGELPEVDALPADDKPAESTALLPAVKTEPKSPPAAEGSTKDKPERAEERTAFMPTLKAPIAKPQRPEEGTAFMPVLRPPVQAPPRRPAERPTQFQPAQRPAPWSAPPAGLLHAQPVRIEPPVEPPPAEAAEPPAEPPRKRRRGLLVGGAIVLVLVIAAGVAAATPYVSNRLGLPWAPNLPKGDAPAPAAVAFSLKPPSTSAPTPTSAGISGALAGPAANGALGTLAGIVLDPSTGATLWDHDSGQPMTPASATKLLTTSAALLKLDHGLQIPTKVVQGAAPDTAIIVAGGDPTLSSLPAGKDSVYPGAAHLDDLVAQVKKASGGAIKKVRIDLSIYSGSQSGPGWAPEDAPSTYAAPVVPAMLDGGRANPAVDEVQRSGDPAGTLLRTFAQDLGATADGTATAPSGAKVLGEVRSAPLTELVDNLLRISDNNLAEAVGRQTAIASGMPATFAGVAQTTLNTLAQNGFDVSGVSLDDGSGLSTLNRVPPKLLAQLLTAAADDRDPRTAKLRPLLEGLPVAGGSGTLADRYNVPGSTLGKGWVRAKTGTLSGVNTLAGVVLDKDGRVLVFAMMSNGSNVLEARPALDALAATLRGCGCR